MTMREDVVEYRRTGMNGNKGRHNTTGIKLLQLTGNRIVIGVEERLDAFLILLFADIQVAPASADRKTPEAVEER